MKFKVGLGLLAGLLTAGLVSAQVETQGRIVVIVQDEQGSRLPGATVTAQAPDTVTSRTVVSNEIGESVLVAMDPSARYTVTVDLSGFAPSVNENILVRSGHTATVRVTMGLAAIAEQVTVTSTTPLVDTTSAITGQDITLQLTESLPTGRSYQSYLQLVPGVMPDDPDQEGNPASKSGLNYRDIQGESGISRDNFYYIDGINVTDGVTGTFGANLNTEIIQEQKVLTGGIPAEYVGTPGLISNVVLKAGSNSYGGSVNYFFHNDGLVRSNENLPDNTFSRYDAAGTFGGPIVQDRAWFFGSYRRLKRTDDVTLLDTNTFVRTTDQIEDQGYIRGTASLTDTDTVSFTWLNDPLDRSGNRDPDVTNAQDRARQQGGNRFNIKYSRLIGTSALLDVGYNKHDGEVSDFTVIRDPENLIIFRDTAQRTLSDEQLGGWGEDIIDERGTRLFRTALDYTLERHDLKAGFEWKRNSNLRDAMLLGSPIGASYVSLSNDLAGLTAGQLVGGGFSGDIQFDPLNSSDYLGFIRTINARPDRDQFYNAYDANHDGTITQEELAANMVFDSTAGNPNGRINYDRTAQTADGEQFTKSEGLSFYAQDTFSFDKWAFNTGLRFERWEHFNTTGESTYQFAWTWAPRLSAIYDIQGDGRQKISAFWGRYYDPIRNNMTNFAGSVSGRVREEQVWAIDDWVTYRIRGGPTQPDALFSPTTKTPYTDDFQIGYEIDLGKNTSFEALYTNRRTRDILEDYDLALYAYDTDGVSTAYPGPLDHPDSLWLGLDYFGFPENPGSNFVIATLAGGKRDYQGIELTFRKRFTDRWQALISYNYNDAEGNTNSDSNADFQGDVLFLDPRAPNQYGTQPGLIHNLIKAAATYQFEMGLEVGAAFQWNSGLLLSQTFSASRRHLPARTDKVGLPPFEFAGFTQNWLAPGVVGTVENPSWGQLDLRVQYVARLGYGLRGEFFVDMFNVTNNQNARRTQDLVAGDASAAFGEDVRWVSPGRFFFGARLSF